MLVLDDLEYDHDGTVAIVAFNRPKILNAMREQSIRELREVVEHLHQSPETRAVIVTGRGRGFCSGEDLSALDWALSQNLDATAAQQKIIGLQDLTRRITDLQVPTIAAVNGPAVGLGAELAMNCDVRLAASSASFAFPEIKHGLSVTNGGMFFLPRLVGHGHMMELLLTGSTIDAQRAEAIGLVNLVVPDEELLAHALRLARSMAAHSPSAIRQVKRGTLRAWTATFEETLCYETEDAVHTLSTELARQGVSAFHISRTSTPSGVTNAR